MEGWVKRRASHRQWLWHNRYMVLNPTARTLLYYSKKNDRTPRKSFALHPNCKVFDPMQRDSGSEAIWCFKIKFEKGAILSSAPSSSKHSHFKSAMPSTGSGNDINDSDEACNLPEEPKEKGRKSRFFGDLSVLELAVPSLEAAQDWVDAIRQCIADMTPRKAPATAPEPDYGHVPGAFQHIVDLRTTESPLRSSDVSVEIVDQGLTVYRERSQLQQSRSVDEFNWNLFKSLGVFVLMVLLMLIFQFNMSCRLCLVLSGSAISLYLAVKNLQRGESEPPVFLAGFHVRGSPHEVHHVLIDDPSSRPLWDGASTSIKVLETKDSHVDVVYLQQRPAFIWPFWYKPRDMVCLRYWAREADGSYVVVLQSTTHAAAPINPKFVRAEVLFWSYLICPLKPEYLTDESSMVPTSYVVQTIRFDPKGWIIDFNLFKHFSYRFVAPMLTSLLSLSSYMRSKDFVDAISRSRVAADPARLLQSSSRKHSRTEYRSRGDANGDGDGDDHSTSASSDGSGAVSAYPAHVTVEDGVVKGVPRAACTVSSHVIHEPDATKYSIRGPSYLLDRIKVQAAPAVFRLVAADMYSFEDPSERPHIGTRSRICREADADPDNAALFTFVAVIIPPSSKNLVVACYYQPMDPDWRRNNPKFAELFEKFMDGDNQYRNERFKLIPDLVQGPYVLRAAMRTRPAIPGTKRVDMGYYRGKNWFEVDIDVGGQSKAKYITSLAMPVAKSLIVDLAFLIESQSVAELPEQIIGVVRFDHTDLGKASRIAQGTTLLPPQEAVFAEEPVPRPPAAASASSSVAVTSSSAVVTSSSAAVGAAVSTTSLAAGDAALEQLETRPRAGTAPSLSADVDGDRRGSFPDVRSLDGTRNMSGSQTSLTQRRPLTKV